MTSPKRETNNNSPKEMKEPDAHTAKEQDSLISCTSGYDTLKTSDTSDKEPHSLTSLNENERVNEQEDRLNEQEDRLNEQEGRLNEQEDKLNHNTKEDNISVGESSDYESFRYRSEENEESEGFAEDSFRECLTKSESSVREYDGGVPLVKSWRASAETIIGECILN